MRHAEGCIIVFAAGNSNDDVGYYFPGNYDKTIAVAAIAYPNTRASFSNWGDEIDVAAPGVDILSLRAAGTDGYGDGSHIVDEMYYRASGTSMACPHFAGQVAAMLSLCPEMGFEEVRNAICSSADDAGDPGFDIYYGYGIMNVHKSLLAIPSSVGRIFLNSAYYNAEVNPIVTVIDTDLNLNTGAQDTAVAVAWSSTETAPESVFLTETGNDTGIFVGYANIILGTTPIAGDGVIVVQDNDTLTVKYDDASPVGSKLDTAAIDRVPPIISSTTLETELTLYEAGVLTATWNTDEPATTLVHYGTTTAVEEVAEEEGYVTAHIITIPNLEPNTIYYVAVESADMAGNIAYDDNGGDFYQFIVEAPYCTIVPANGFTFEIPEHSDSFEDIITISNLSAMELLFEIAEASKPWISFSQDSGALVQGESVEIIVTFNPSSLGTGTYTTEIVIYHNGSPKGPAILPVTLNVIPAPAVHYQSYSVIDDWSCGSFLVNGDERFNPGERVGLRIDAKNIGTLPATGVNATLSLTQSDPYVTIIDGTINFPDIPAGAAASSLDNFVIEAGPGAPYGHKVDFNAVIADSEGHIWDNPFSIILSIPYFIEFHSQAVQISNNTYEYWDYYRSCKPQMSIDSNDNIYVVWQDVPEEEGAYDLKILFRRSNNCGRTWMTQVTGIDTNPKASGLDSGLPRITSDNNGNVYVMWQDWRFYGQPYALPDLYLNYSNDYGGTWQPNDIRLRADTTEHIDPFVYAITSDDNGHVYVVWADWRNGKGDIFFNYSADHGHTWQPNDIRLDTDAAGSADSRWPTMVSDDNGNVYVAWTDWRDGSGQINDRQIYLNYSNDHGETWQPNDIRLDAGLGGGSPNITIDNSGNVYVVWVKSGVRFTYSNDYGHTWHTNPLRIDSDPGTNTKLFPQMCADENGNVYVIWLEYRSPVGIYFNVSHDYGHTWQAQDARIPANKWRWPNFGIACDNNGHVYVIYDNKGPYAQTPSGVFINYSLDHGHNWQPNDLLLPGADNAWLYGGAQIKASSNGNVYVLWESIIDGIPQAFFLSFEPISSPELYDIPDITCEEDSLCAFDITARSPQNDSETELFFITDELAPGLQGNMSSADLTTSFDSITKLTTGIFSWIPPLDCATVYYPVVFVARDPLTDLYDYQAITIGVTPAGYKGVLPGESIQSVVDDSISGDNIYVFKDTHEEDIQIENKDISLIGENLSTAIKGNISFCNSDSSIEKLSILYKQGSAVTYSDSYYNDFKLQNDAGITAINSAITVTNCIIMPAPDIFGAAKFGKGIQIWSLYGGTDISPIIDNCEISNTDTGIYLHSQAFGGAILGEIKNNALDNNNYGILLRMHKEKPLIHDNEITNSTNGIHITYEDGTLLQERLDNIINNTFFGNTDDIWCDELGE